MPKAVTDVLEKPPSLELLDRDIARLAYVARDTPTWAKLIDFEETPPTAVEEPIRHRDAARSVTV